MINLDNIVLSDFIASNNIQTYLPHGNNCKVNSILIIFINILKWYKIISFW